ncbi:hypothetical protein [Streptomyces sp. NPDC004629]|uniref:hypothetical protein n=1 Tax=Streptomyces sp. NPDC004629 TaxID=3364705 RepID=UPI003673CC62
MAHAFNGTLGTPKATRDIIIGGVLGLSGGFLWEKYLSPWAKANLALHIKDLGTWIRGRVPWINRWLGAPAAEGTDAIGHQLEDLTDLLDEAMRDWGGLRPSSVRLLPVGDSITYGDGSTEAWLNKSVAGDLREGWKSIGKIATGTGTGGAAVQFADADTDRDADYFVIGSAGTATWWQNDDVATRTDNENGFKKGGRLRRPQARRLEQRAERDLRGPRR